MTKTDIERRISQIHKSLFDGVITVEGLVQYSTDISDYCMYISDMEIGELRNINPKVLENFLEINLIYYTYSENGAVLISDNQYDKCMQKYMSLGYPQLTTTTYEAPESLKKKWRQIPHEHPNMVGSLDKVYSIASFIDRLMDISALDGSTKKIALVPKYDGTSCCINIKNGAFRNAVTRKDGKIGLDISNVVKNAKNFKEIMDLFSYITGHGSGAIKCELLCSKQDYEPLSGVFANRRSAVSAIVSSPKNISYAGIITIMPLLIYSDMYDDSYFYTAACEKSGYLYINPGYVHERDGVYKYSTKYIVLSSDRVENYKKYGDIIEELLQEYRSPEFPFRVDGIVAYCGNVYSETFKDDAMATSLAYKVNTETGITKVIDGYFSIGRGGRATPMIKVEPCECNETIVQDVSLSTLGKAKKFDLHYGDTIEIVSSGDVIPMIKDVVKRKKHSDPIKFDKHCPYCGSKLEYVSEEILSCTNNGCPRLVSGQATTFFVRMGMKGFSDQTFEDLFKNKIYSTNVYLFIKATLELDADDLVGLPGWDTTKATNFIDEIKRIRETPIDEAKFLSALGIPDVGPKTAQKLVEHVPFSKMEKYVEKEKKNAFIDEMLYADGCGAKTARKIAEYIMKYWDFITDVKSLCAVVPYRKAIGSFALTGFSEDEKYEIAQDLAKLGYDVGGVTKTTVALVAANPKGSSTKIQKAKKYDIPIISRKDIKWFINHIV